ncbi:MAG: hypothetical protein ACQEQ0_04765 [Bacteroidota bacterium]
MRNDKNSWVNSILLIRPLFAGLVLVILLMTGGRAGAQYIPVHPDHEGIYSFLDELAGEGAIDIYTSIKPLGRATIARFLDEASGFPGLTSRQRREIEFYLRDYGKELRRELPEDKRFDLFYYSDSLFQLTVNPILGLTGYARGDETAFHRRNGGEIYGSIGEHFGFYGSLRDNYESEPLGGQSMLVRRRGGVYKGDEAALDYSEARGGISWSWNWGRVGLHKDHFEWGSGYNGANIFSGNIPSHAFFSLNLRPVDWFEVNYLHGWLVSEVVDSLRSFEYYDGTREVFSDKYVAASVVSVRPLPALHVSAGNSIVYADNQVNPAYWVPFLFYKSVDHTYNGASNRVGQNAQMFLDISSRQIRHLHLYSTLFVDEVSINRMFDRDQHSNYISFKGGARVTGIPPDWTLTVEYTRTHPMVYQHVIPTTTWESNGYNMGHYLGDNSDEWFVSAAYRPVRGVKIELEYIRSRKGKDYQFILADGGERDHPEINMDEPRWGLPFMNEVRWGMEKATLKGSWQVVHDAYVSFALGYRANRGPDTDQYLPSLFQSDGFEGKFGVRYGF